MILPDLFLQTRINQQWKFSGTDSLQECLDKDHFRSYPHEVDYSYNSRGFRDSEWPQSLSELKNAIWCVGDSFTVGIGSPYKFIWPQMLSAATGRRCINVSMDGASNNWISRQAQQIIREVAPTHMVVMWSYLHRRENPDITLSDEDRRWSHTRSSSHQDWYNFLTCQKNIELGVEHLVHFMVPNFYNLDIDSIWANVRSSSWPLDPPATLAELNALPQWILSEIKNLHDCFDEISSILEVKQNQINIIQVEQQDIARDGHHFDLITAEWVAKQAAQRLGC